MKRPSAWKPGDVTCRGQDIRVPQGQWERPLLPHPAGGWRAGARRRPWRPPVPPAAHGCGGAPPPPPAATRRPPPPRTRAAAPEQEVRTTCGWGAGPVSLRADGHDIVWMSWGPAGSAADTKHTLQRRPQCKGGCLLYPACRPAVHARNNAAVLTCGCATPCWTAAWLEGNWPASAGSSMSAAAASPAASRPCGGSGCSGSDIVSSAKLPTVHSLAESADNRLLRLVNAVQLAMYAGLC